MFVLASNHFWKCFSVNVGVWLRMKNKFFRKYFQLTVCFNGFDPEISFSQNLHLKQFPDSRAKRERERERGRRESPDHAFEFADLRTHEPIFDLEPSTHRSTNPWTDLWPRAFDPRAFDFTGDPEPSRHEPTNRSLSVWFWFFVWFWSTHEPIYVSVWFWFFTFSLWSLILLLLLWWCGW